jgi:hypothetical protein
MYPNQRLTVEVTEVRLQTISTYEITNYGYDLHKAEEALVKSQKVYRNGKKNYLVEYQTTTFRMNVSMERRTTRVREYGRNN